jgi:hypothetical protein
MIVVNINIEEVTILSHKLVFSHWYNNFRKNQHRVKTKNHVSNEAQAAAPKG